MEVVVNNLTRETISINGFASLANRILLLEKIKKKTFVVITIVGETAIKKLNYKYRQENLPTDVLSFNEPRLWPATEKDGSLGELFICPAVIKRNSKKFNVCYFEELKRVTIHGLLHLMGHKHKKNIGESTEEIFSRQEKYLKLTSRLSLTKQ